MLSVQITLLYTTVKRLFVSVQANMCIHRTLDWEKQEAKLSLG